MATVTAQLRQMGRIKRAHPASDGPPQAALGFDYAAAYEALANHFSFGLVLMNSAGNAVFMNDSARLMTGRDTRTIRDWLARKAGLSYHGAHLVSKRPAPRKSHHSSLLIDVDNSHLSGPLLITVKRLFSEGMVEVAIAVLLYSQHTLKDHGVRLVAEAVGLTPSETTVAQLLSQGRRIDEITQALSISRPTVNFHLHNIFCKTATTRQTELVTLLHCVQLNE